jgi:hypothetical protein
LRRENFSRLYTVLFLDRVVSSIFEAMVSVFLWIDPQRRNPIGTPMYVKSVWGYV